MRVINLVDRLDRVNFGIWNAAIATARELESRHGMPSEIWYPAATDEAAEADLNGARRRPLQRLDAAGLDAAAREAGLDPTADIIVSHGCWQYPTRWGRALQRRGFRWVAVPQGMLETWSLAQKRLRKALYLRLAERPALRQAAAVRAVSKPEWANLRKVFGDKSIWIPNAFGSGAKAPALPAFDGTSVFLFMARLHHKKGVLPLVEGWRRSPLSGHPDFSLRIAGPDDGELGKLRAFLARHPEISNITYLGPVYGERKEQLLRECHYYILPSHSEGFPTSVLEAMWHGLVPLISEGCNFPDVLEQGIGIPVAPDASAVRTGLERAYALDQAARKERAAKAQACIEDGYTHAKVASRLADLYEFNPLNP
jgi:glycosyltransferase involved in cell wall biosynthesis